MHIYPIIWIPVFQE